MSGLSSSLLLGFAKGTPVAGAQDASHGRRIGWVEIHGLTIQSSVPGELGKLAAKLLEAERLAFEPASVTLDQ